MSGGGFLGDPRVHIERLSAPAAVDSICLLEPRPDTGAPTLCAARGPRLELRALSTAAPSATAGPAEALSLPDTADLLLPLPGAPPVVLAVGRCGTVRLLCIADAPDRAGRPAEAVALAEASLPSVAGEAFFRPVASQCHVVRARGRRDGREWCVALSTVPGKVHLVRAWREGPESDDAWNVACSAVPWNGRSGGSRDAGRHTDALQRVLALQFMPCGATGLDADGKLLLTILYRSVPAPSALATTAASCVAVDLDTGRAEKGPWKVLNLHPGTAAFVEVRNGERGAAGRAVPTGVLVAGPDAVAIYTIDAPPVVHRIATDAAPGPDVAAAAVFHSPGGPIAVLASSAGRMTAVSLTTGRAARLELPDGAHVAPTHQLAISPAGAGCVLVASHDSGSCTAFAIHGDVLEGGGLALVGGAEDLSQPWRPVSDAIDLPGGVSSDPARIAVAVGAAPHACIRVGTIGAEIVADAARGDGGTALDIGVGARATLVRAAGEGRVLVASDERTERTVVLVQEGAGWRALRAEESPFDVHARTLFASGAPGDLCVQVTARKLLAFRWRATSEGRQGAAATWTPQGGGEIVSAASKAQRIAVADRGDRVHLLEVHQARGDPLDAPAVAALAAVALPAPCRALAVGAETLAAATWAAGDGRGTETTVYTLPWSPLAGAQRPARLPADAVGGTDVVTGLSLLPCGTGRARGEVLLVARGDGSVTSCALDAAPAPRVTGRVVVGQGPVTAVSIPDSGDGAVLAVSAGAPPRCALLRATRDGSLEATPVASDLAVGGVSVCPQTDPAHVPCVVTTPAGRAVCASLRTAAALTWNVALPGEECIALTHHGASRCIVAATVTPRGAASLVFVDDATLQPLLRIALSSGHAVTRLRSLHIPRAAAGPGEALGTVEVVVICSVAVRTARAAAGALPHTQGLLSLVGAEREDASLRACVHGVLPVAGAPCDAATVATPLAPAPVGHGRLSQPGGVAVDLDLGDGWHDAGSAVPQHDANRPRGVAGGVQTVACVGAEGGESDSDEEDPPREFAGEHVIPRGSVAVPLPLSAADAADGDHAGADADREDGRELLLAVAVDREVLLTRTTIDVAGAAAWASAESAHSNLKQEARAATDEELDLTALLNQTDNQPTDGTPPPIRDAGPAQRVVSTPLCRTALGGHGAVTALAACPDSASVIAWGPVQPPVRLVAAVASGARPVLVSCQTAPSPAHVGACLRVGPGQDSSCARPRYAFVSDGAALKGHSDTPPGPAVAVWGGFDGVGAAARAGCLAFLSETDARELAVALEVLAAAHEAGWTWGGSAAGRSVPDTGRGALRDLAAELGFGRDVADAPPAAEDVRAVAGPAFAVGASMGAHRGALFVDGGGGVWRVEGRAVAGRADSRTSRV